MEKYHLQKKENLYELMVNWLHREWDLVGELENIK